MKKNPFILPIMALSLGLSANSAQAQNASPASTSQTGEGLDQETLAEAQMLVELLLPTETRAAMIDGMIKPTIANVTQGMMQQGELKSMLDNDPNLEAIFNSFIDDVTAQSTKTLQAELPGMAKAMANAYARRFSKQEMIEIRSFFETNAGQSYIKGSYSIMSDPDIGAWQRDLMAKSMADLPVQLEKFKTSIDAYMKNKKTNK